MDNEDFVSDLIDINMLKPDVPCLCEKRAFALRVIQTGKIVDHSVLVLISPFTYLVKILKILKFDGAIRVGQAEPFR